MTHPTAHLPPWTLDALAENELPHAERALALEHVKGCATCAADLEAARAVFASVAALPHYDPSPSFAQAVMARVRVQPALAPEPAKVRVRRWLPHTRKGWMGLGALVLLPAAPVMALLAWLFSHPGVSAGALWDVGRERTGAALWSALVRATEWVVQSGAFQWAVTEAGRLGGPVALAVLALFALSVPVSAWAMVRLLRAPVGGMTHAS